MVTFTAWLAAQENRTDAVGALAADGLFKDADGTGWPDGTVTDVYLVAASCGPAPAFWDAFTRAALEYQQAEASNLLSIH